MPIYLYQCNDCDTKHEVLQKFSDAPLSTCPDCGGNVQKLFTPEVGLSFKGSGFYITDYVRNNGKANGSSEKKAASTTQNASSTDDKS
ncbi:zinc ribbon domain-containing protein [candidate division KSB1 bacterium]|nr:zinc ribbon domain-containing protein [candidate division KSB1 bacterium]